MVRRILGHGITNSGGHLILVKHIPRSADHYFTLNKVDQPSSLICILVSLEDYLSLVLCRRQLGFATTALMRKYLQIKRITSRVEQATFQPRIQ